MPYQSDTGGESGDRRGWSWGHAIWVVLPTTHTGHFLSVALHNAVSWHVQEHLEIRKIYKVNIEFLYGTPSTH